MHLIQSVVVIHRMAKTKVSKGQYRGVEIEFSIKSTLTPDNKSSDRNRAGRGNADHRGGKSTNRHQESNRPK